MAGGHQSEQTESFLFLSVMIVRKVAGKTLRERRKTHKQPNKCWTKIKTSIGMWNPPTPTLSSGKTRLSGVSHHAKKWEVATLS